MRSLLLSCLLLLGACANWNEQSAHFTNLEQFRASRYGSGGFLPPDLLPPSARKIHFRYNIDTTEVEATFVFAPAEADRVIGPFRNPDQALLHALELDGSVPPSEVRSPMFVRCASNRVEFLQVTEMASARYWTSVDRELRRISCSAAPTTPLL